MKDNRKSTAVEKEILASVYASEPSQLQQIQGRDSVISARHLTKKFGDETAVQDISLKQYMPPFEDVFVELVRPEVSYG